MSTNKNSDGENEIQERKLNGGVNIFINEKTSQDRENSQERRESASNAGTDSGNEIIIVEA